MATVTGNEFDTIAYRTNQILDTDRILDPNRQTQSESQRSHSHYEPRKAFVGVQVLIVHASLQRAMAWATRIRSWGHDPRIANDGYHALRIAAEQRPQLVMIDLELVWMNAFQLAHQLRVDFPNKECLIVGITINPARTQNVRSSDAGIDLLLVEPINPLDIETLLMLESYRTAQMLSPC